MKRKPTFRLYKIEVKLMTYSVFHYFDGKQSFFKELENLKQQNKNVVGYKYLRGEFKAV
jgi:hypothetical protein